MDRFVELAKHDFIGRDAALRETRGGRRALRLVTLLVERPMPT